MNRIDENLFKGLSSLKELILEANQIEEIHPNAFQDLTNLETLYLSRNKLTRIDENIFKGLSNLYLLIVNNNEINEIDEFAFSDLSNLGRLDLSHNMIEQLGSNVFRNLTKLQFLTLHNNQLFSIDSKTFKYVRPKLILLVSLFNNSFSTECSSYCCEKLVLRNRIFAISMNAHQVFVLSKMPFLSDWEKFKDQFLN